MSGVWFDEMWDGEGGSGSALFNVTEPSNDTTLSCAARSIQDPVILPYSTALTITVRAILAAYYIITALAGIVLNTLVIVLVAKYKKLRTHSFAIALQVVGLDLVCSLIFLVSQANVVANHWVFGRVMCILTGLLVQAMTHVHLHLMLILALDRYLSTCRRSFYLKHKVKVSVCGSIATWLFEVLNHVPSLFRNSDCIAFNHFKWMCAHSFKCKPACYIRTVGNLGIVLIRAAAYIFMYSRLFYKARRIGRVEVSQPPEGAADQDLHKREHKTSVTFFWLFVTAHLCTLPSIVVFAMVGSISSGLSGVLPVELYLMAVCSYAVLALLSVIDPLLLMRLQLRMMVSHRAIPGQSSRARTASTHCDIALFEVIANPAAVDK